MEKKVVNPWQWQNQLGYAQAIEVKNHQGTLYCSGQAAISAEGHPLSGNMAEQIALALQNLEQVIAQAGYQPSGIVRLNFYTTSIAEFFPAYGTIISWMQGYQLMPSSTLLEVEALAFSELKIEIEATVVR